MNSIVRGIINFLIGVISGATEEAQKNTTTTKTGQRQSTKKSTPKPRSSSSSSARSGSQHRYEDPATSNRPQTSIREASIAEALAHASYTPVMDGDADPGEVVWTWVPYEEDAAQGKDRPVLVLARAGGRFVVAQLTSRDHDRDAAQEARWGRHWHDVGTGAWDPQGRPSEMRLDRLLLVDPAAVRREGATLSRTVFEQATRALRRHWG